MEINSLKKDVNAAEDGTWIEWGSSSRVKIAQWLNRHHAAYMRDISNTYGKDIFSGDVEEEKAQSLVAGQWIHVLTDIEGFTEGGEEVEYSRELVVKWASDPQLADFFKEIAIVARNERNYLEETIKQMGEKSPPA